MSGDSDPEGRWFESSRAHHKKTAVILRSGLFVMFPASHILARICLPAHFQLLQTRPKLAVWSGFRLSDVLLAFAAFSATHAVFSALWAAAFS